MMKLFFLLLLLSGTADRESLRFSFSAEQGYDSSCGLSVLASLMDRYWKKPVDEASLVREFFSAKLAGGDLTVSFADMASVLKAKGFVCKAYQMTYDQLEKALGSYAPLIVHYDRPLGHFALALSARRGELLVADPAEGATSLGRRHFESRWSGKVLVALLPGRSVDPEIIGKAAASVWGRCELLDRVALARPGTAPW